MSIILKSEFKQAISDDPMLLAKVCEAAGGVSVFTVQRWMRNDSDLLTRASILHAIKTHLQMSDSETLTTEPITA